MAEINFRLEDAKDIPAPLNEITFDLQDARDTQVVGAPSKVQETHSALKYAIDNAVGPMSKGKWAIGAAEAVMAGIGGFGGAIVGGMVSVGHALAGGGTDEVSDTFYRIQNAWAYQPKTKAGQSLMHAMAYPIEKLHEMAVPVSDAVYENYRPYTIGGKEYGFTKEQAATIVGTLVEGVPQVGLMLLGVRGGKARSLPGTLPKEAKPYRGTKMERQLDDYHQTILEYIARGETAPNAGKMAQLEHGLTTDKVLDMIQATGKQMRIPLDPAKAAAILDLAKMDGWARLNRGGTRQFLEDFVEPLSNVFRELAPRVLGKLRFFERKWRSELSDTIQRVEPLLKEIEALPTPTQVAITRAFRNQQRGTAAAILDAASGQPGRGKFIVETLGKILDDMYIREQALGIKHTYIQDYFPNRVIDPSKLRSKKLISRHTETKLKKTIRDQESELGRKLTPEEYAVLASNTLRESKASIRSGAYTKERKMDVVPDSLADAYMSSRDALHSRIREHVMDTNRREFFGKHSVKHGERPNELHLENSIAKMLAEDQFLLQDKTAMGLVKDALMVRFGMGDVSPAALVQNVRNITYTGTLSNLWADLTQLKDIGVAFYRYGFRNTIVALVGKKFTKAADLAITQAAAELEVAGRLSARVMEKSLRTSFFNAFDRFGKTTLLNAALRDKLRTVHTAKGQQTLAQKWGKVLGAEETAALIKDLKAGKVTENVRTWLFHELSEVQPISLLEVPKRYLMHPDGRLMYTLNTFALRQLDMVRKDVGRDFAKGKYASGSYKLAKIAMYMGATGTTVEVIKKLLRGQKVRPEDVPVMFFENLLGIFMASRYMIEVTGQKGPGAAAWDRVSPPFFDMADAIFKDLKRIMTDSDMPPGETMKFAPIAGNFWYYIFGPGAQRYMDEERRRLERLR
jgi:hypothetical protein